MDDDIVKLPRRFRARSPDTALFRHLAGRFAAAGPEPRGVVAASSPSSKPSNQPKSKINSRRRRRNDPPWPRAQNTLRCAKSPCLHEYDGLKGITMTLADLSSLGSFISGVAVLISLIYLGLQVRQNTMAHRVTV